MATEPLILLPGRLCDARLYRHQLAHLGDVAEMRVGDVTRSDRFEYIARDVLEDAPPRFALAGLSLGGIVALEILRQAPQRVTGLALLDSNPGGNAPRHIAEFAAQIQQVRVGTKDFLKLTTEQLYPQMVHPARRQNRALQEEVVAMALAVGPAALVRQNIALSHRSDRWKDLLQITCPTLVLCGREDTICPPALHKEMARLIPGARLEIIENCGHLSTMEQPERVTELLREWLMSLYHFPEVVGRALPPVLSETER